jgi:hypothetical protein
LKPARSSTRVKVPRSWPISPGRKATGHSRRFWFVTRTAGCWNTSRTSRAALARLVTQAWQLICSRVKAGLTRSPTQPRCRA